MDQQTIPQKCWRNFISKPASNYEFYTSNALAQVEHATLE
jgi:hypothetical protein